MAEKTIGQLLVTLNADTKQFEASMQQSLTKTEGFVKGHEAQFKKIGAAVTAAGAAITASLGIAIKTYANAGDAAAKMADRTGMSVENIMQLSHAAKLSDTSIEGLEVGVKRMAKVLTDAESGLESANEPLQALGLSIDQLKGKNPDQQFDMLAMAIANVEDPTKRAALAQEIFGRSGTQLLPMLSDGAEGLAKMKQEAVDLGIVMSEDAAKRAEAFNDSITSLKGSLQGVRNAVAEQLMPALTPMIQKITEIIQHVTEWMKQNPALTKTIVTVAGVVGVLATVLGPIIMALPLIVSGITTLTTIIPTLGTVFGALTGPIGWVILGITGLIAISRLLIKHWDDVKTGMAKVWNGIASIVEDGVNLYINCINLLLRTVTKGMNFVIRQMNKLPKVNIPEIKQFQIQTVQFKRADIDAMKEARAEKETAKKASVKPTVEPINTEKTKERIVVKMPQVTVPSPDIKMPQVTVPSPDIKMPQVTVPSPDIKMPEIVMPANIDISNIIESTKQQQKQIEQLTFETKRISAPIQPPAITIGGTDKLETAVESTMKISDRANFYKMTDEMKNSVNIFSVAVKLWDSITKTVLTKIKTISAKVPTFQPEISTQVEVDYRKTSDFPRQMEVPTGIHESAISNREDGVKTIQINNPLSPDDLAKVIRAVERSQEMKGYVKTGLQGV